MLINEKFILSMLFVIMLGHTKAKDWMNESIGADRERFIIVF